MHQLGVTFGSTSQWVKYRLYLSKNGLKAVVSETTKAGSKRKNEKLEISTFKKYRVLKKSFVNIFNKSSKFLLYNSYTQ